MDISKIISNLVKYILTNREVMCYFSHVWPIKYTIYLVLSILGVYGPFQSDHIGEKKVCFLTTKFAPLNDMLS